MDRVLLVDPIAPSGEEALSRGADVLRAPDSDPGTIRRMAQEADGIITRSKLPDDLFVAATRLRAVAIRSTRRPGMRDRRIAELDPGYS
jgi:D-3-phosphoglycerate dehydrogenase